MATSRVGLRHSLASPFRAAAAETTSFAGSAAALCATVKRGARLPLWVIFDRDEASSRSSRVRFASKSNDSRHQSELTRMGWTGRAPAPNDSGKGLRSTRSHHYVKAEERDSCP